MDYVQLIGLGAAVFTTLANIPQTYKIIRDKNTEGVSTITYAVLLVGNALWVTYGILKTDWPIIIANSITVVTCLIILVLNFTSKKFISVIHETVLPEGVKKEARKKNKKP